MHNRPKPIGVGLMIPSIRSYDVMEQDLKSRQHVESGLVKQWDDEHLRCKRDNTWPVKWMHIIQSSQVAKSL